MAGTATVRTTSTGLRDLATDGHDVFYADGTRLVARDATSGALHYQAEAYMSVGDLAAANGLVYVGLRSGAAAFEARRGILRWWWQEDVGLVRGP